ncbi:MAG: hypothetical protein JWP29_4520, partial [Rhodoferax sp.]|nr:hypothetical protein [Rhodoferax sp.]
MLLATGVLMAVSGLPAWTVLVGTAMVFSLGGLALGVLTPALFMALPLRLVGLLEHDLLQALPLYVLVGALLNRLPLIDTLFRVALHLLRRTAAAPYLAGLGLGALLAPMNGSVGASVTMLSRAMGRRMQGWGMAPEAGAALVCTASTVGVVVPPSLVLILLGDAMLRAHTEALNASHGTALVIDTQDIFHGALGPAAAMLLLFAVLTWWLHRGANKVPAAAPDAPAAGAAGPSRSDWAIAIGSVACILGLLGGVTLGLFYAVEGAATGALVLCAFGLASRSLTREVGREVLRDTLATTGALFALLMAATTYTLVLRALGTDVWIGDFLHSLPGGSPVALAVVLAMLGLSAFVLDAFEIIFVIVPIVMPPLLTLVPDATWVAVLTLLVLQMSFLLPPFGYAILMATSLLPHTLSPRRLARALAPYLLVQAAVIALVLCWPGVVWHTRAAASTVGDGPVLSEEALQKLLDAQRPEAEPEPEAPELKP